MLGWLKDCVKVAGLPDSPPKEAADVDGLKPGPAERGAIEPRATPLTKPVEAASVIEALFPMTKRLKPFLRHPSLA